MSCLHIGQFGIAAEHVVQQTTIEKSMYVEDNIRILGTRLSEHG